MSVIERRAREKELLHGKILEAASQLFAEEGLENTSIRKIANRIEYSPATIYLHFKDKAELVEVICQGALRKLLGVISRTGVACDPTLRLRECCRAYVEFGVAYPRHYTVLFGRPFPAKREEEHGSYPHPCLSVFEWLRSAIDACTKGGFIPKCDLELTAQTTWMLLHGITLFMIGKYSDLHASTGDSLDRTKDIDSALDVVISGLMNSH